MATTQRTSSTTSSDDIRPFARRILLFFAPLILGFGLVLGMLYRAGELETPDRVVDLQQRPSVADQQRSPILYLPEFHQWDLFFQRYHFAGTVRRHPKVLVFGSSRVKTVRSEFFRHPEAQFNAGIPGTVSGVGTWRRFLEALPEGGLPEVVLINIDPWWFGAAASVLPGRDFLRYYSSLEIIDVGWRKGIRWAIEQRHQPSPETGFLGVQARREHSGLRPDGSLYLARREPDQPVEEIQRLARDGKLPFLHDVPTLSAKALEELEHFLQYCERHHIRVIGFISTFKPSNFAVMKKEPRVDYYWKVAPAIGRMLARFHGELFDMSDPAAIGCTDAQYIDSLHESEVCTVRTLLTMAKRSDALRSLVDTERLEKALVSRKSEWELDF